MEKWTDTKKENKLGFIVLVICIIVCVISVTYAIWTQVFKGEKENIITTGTLILEITDEKAEINLTYSVPMSDTKGLSLTPYTFTIKNTGDTDANYRISLVNDTEAYINDNCNDNKLDWDNIKYAFNIGSNATIMNLLSEKSGVLYEGSLNSKSSTECLLRLWIDSKTENEAMGKHFHGKIKIEAIQSDRTLDS